ncbi:hypothetical protein NITLEN_10042 [Nitrospira lenta]|uniref:Uncharacterized protein n=1 Tax=Nitrospira lenta TaxID=1436998 RepID=A0A330L7P3_9BACT|nr:hypothetical protein NITLEN_10042 [Nitrospira lenta]
MNIGAVTSDLPTQHLSMPYALHRRIILRKIVILVNMEYIHAFAHRVFYASPARTGVSRSCQHRPCESC